MRGTLTIFLIFAVLCLTSIGLAKRVKRQRIFFPDEIVNSTSRNPACDCSMKTTNEYNPVCGTDGVTYWNPSRLKCIAKCGKNVQLVRFGACQPLFPHLLG